MKKIFGLIGLVFIIYGCAVIMPSQRVPMIKPTEISEEQFRNDMRECDKLATLRIGQNFGQLFSVLFSPPGMESFLSTKFENRKDREYYMCMENRGYQLK